MFKFSFSIGQGAKCRQWKWPKTETHSQEDDWQYEDLPEGRRRRYQFGPISIDTCTDQAATKGIVLPQNRCPLFKLPAEIRSYIYELVLSHDDGTMRVNKLPPKHHLSILQTCRRVLLEAETIFYSTHRFQHSELWLKSGEIRREAITAIAIITSSAGKAFSDMEDLHHYPNLKSLHIEREMSIRYLNVAEWSIMWRQMKIELGKLPCLREVKIFTPEASSELTPAEEERLQKLKRVDAMLSRGDRASK